MLGPSASRQVVEPVVHIGIDNSEVAGGILMIPFKSNGYPTDVQNSGQKGLIVLVLYCAGEERLGHAYVPQVAVHVHTTL